MSTLYDVIKRPIVTEKGVAKKDAERTLCFEVSADANKTQIKNAVQTLFKIKVEDVRTSTTAGKLRRRGRRDEARCLCWGQSASLWPFWRGLRY